MKPYFETDNGVLYCGSCLETLKQLPDQHVNCCITSPPYWGLRDYGVDGQIGLEKTPEEYVEKVVAIFREVRRVLADDGTLWLNLGDTYAAARSYQVVDNKHKDVGNKIGHTVPMGLKQKDLVGIPWRVAFALQADGWYLRQDIIWSKPNPMPESVTDRCTKAHEYIFLLSKNQKYYYDHEAIREPLSESTKKDPRMKDMGRTYSGKGRLAYGETDKANGQMESWRLNPNGRNKRSVWTVTTKPFKEAHFATFPPALIEPCALAGCPEGGTVLDMFFGAGTSGVVANKHNRKFIGIELNKEYAEIAAKRITAENKQLKIPGC